MLAPLRKIISEKVETRTTPSGAAYQVEIEILECGHTMRRKADIYGPTNAYHRRCKHCASADST